MGAGSDDEHTSPEEYAEQIWESLQAKGWELDQTHVSETIYLLGGTTRTSDGENRRGVGIIAAGFDEQLETTHLEYLKQAQAKYDAEQLFVHARNGVPDEIAAQCADTNITIISPPEGNGATQVGSKETKDTESGGNPTPSDQPSNNQTGTDEERRSPNVSRRTVVGAGLLGAVGASGWYLFESGLLPDTVGSTSANDSNTNETSGSPVDAGSDNSLGTQTDSKKTQKIGGVSQYRYNSANTGYTTDEIGPTDSITEQWTYETQGIDSSPAVMNDSLYIGTYGHRFFALNASDGTEQWTYADTWEVSSSPAVVDGTVYFGDWDSKVYALDTTGGTKQWVSGGGGTDSSPAIVDDTVYIGGDKVSALDAINGTEQWSYDATGNSSPAVVGDTVYIGSADNNIYALDATDGTEQWAYETNLSVESSPAVVAGQVYVGSDDGTVYALDATDGTEQWAYETNSAVRSSPAVVDGIVYVGSWDNHIYALDAADGTVQWTHETGDRVESSPVVVNNTIYIGGHEGVVYALDAADGMEKWTHDTGGRIRSSPVVVDNTVYVGNTEGTLYALTEE